VLLSVVNLRKEFPISRDLFGAPSAHVRAVDGVSFEVREREIVGLVGESGCGKSTVGKCAVGLLPPTSGSVFWKGESLVGSDPSPLHRLRRKYQLVFQNPFASLNPRQRVKDILGEPLRTQEGRGMGGETETIKVLLEQVGLSANSSEKFPHEFSGGQRQRVALARALALGPDFMVLDEPISSLDVSIQASILNLLARVNVEKGIAYLFISHDLQVVSYLSHRVMVMYLGRIVEEGMTKEVLRQPRHPYTRILLEAARGGKVEVQGEPPSPVKVPSGCAFHPRCPFAEDRCRVESQVLQTKKEGWKVACWKSDHL
jgi:oligopeptide/dipeptide ABC transporter ATP-binding protein